MNKSTIIVVAVIVMVAVVYFYVAGGSLPTGFVLLKPDSLPAEDVSNETLSLLNQVKTLEINTSLFSGLEYQTLRDFTVAVPVQGVKRDNPFEPIPGVAGPFGSQAQNR